ncbi:hypothetical protein UAY_00232 [Enterococcus moraviensis ATCC BAA-383]|uniref:Uncharacterized protein n=1 Tax=Enterococcus moraviensis ATCC BAA-383 TaxID=1158609 RepID=R2RCY5_9ENTE|nr:hypothetical protein UAY_00232 [Enterococcus moraviensis ATCC BAA-383]EOT65233.1 hypothetical protein I586_02967 [Enterococcus moraviensis ATCC BAA-383]
MYQGSTSPEKISSQAGEVKHDWWDNNKEILNNVKNSYNRPNTIFDPTNKSQVCYSLLMEKNFEVS